MKKIIAVTSLGVCLGVNPFFTASAASSNPIAVRAEIKRLSQQQAQLQAELDKLKVELAAKQRPENGTKFSENKSTEQEQAQEHGYFRLLGPLVTTSPYLTLRSAYDASDLVVNLPSMNEDLRLLQKRQALEKALGSEGAPAYRPRLDLSGKLEAQAYYQKPFGEKSVGQVDLSAAELDTMAEVGPWAFGFMSIAYDNSFNSSFGGSRILNSRFYLKRGFITIGDLSHSPFYGSIGQLYVPFGRYNSYLLDDPMTQLLGRTNERAVVLGYSRNGLYASGYTFKGAVETGETGWNQGGLNAGYAFSNDKYSGEFGAGMIANIADSEGMQVTGGNQFGGFGTSTATETLRHGVPAVDLHGNIGVGAYSFDAEYVGATQRFALSNLGFDGHGAKPQALDLEASYKFNVLSKPSVVALHYAHSWQALALNLPENSYIGLISTSIWKNTIESLEYRHDVNYSSSTSASGQGIPVTVAGHTQNLVLSQIGVYF